MQSERVPSRGRCMEMLENKTLQYCFNSANVLCIKELRATSVTVILYCIAAAGVLLASCGNLLVIISIVFFKQLHTPTNILVLSLAFADFLVGILIMPFMAIHSVETCWYFGDIFCVIYSILFCLFTDTSIFNIVAIAVDRSLAICYPLLYSTKVTVRLVSIFTASIWFLALSYACAAYFFNLPNDSGSGENYCPENCIMTQKQAWISADLLVSFMLPFSVIITLYINIYIIASRHARFISTQFNTGGSKRNIPKKSERKAAKTLGVVVAVFIACWSPFYIFSVINQFITFSISPLTYNALVWLAYMNSGMNPIIYAFFYPWFRKSLKLLVTFKILNPVTCAQVSEKKKHKFPGATLFFYENGMDFKLHVYSSNFESNTVNNVQGGIKSI
uniref:G-protein coupled receptors family 1 profile domain-containing protein n=1 Tax=Erpetoichthys calabaricus TaxID=27687 RepID=A0A8C4X459_ERPCA